MLETVGDIWRFAPDSLLVITTNGTVSRDGRAVFGRGLARDALHRFPDLADILGSLLAKEGNHVFYLGNGLVSFPVEESPWSLPDLRLISRSAGELRALADSSSWQRIVVPRPGCGGGGLAWDEVKPLLERWFDDRFLVISKLHHNQRRSSR